MERDFVYASFNPDDCIVHFQVCLREAYHNTAAVLTQSRVQRSFQACDMWSCFDWMFALGRSARTGSCPRRLEGPQSVPTIEYALHMEHVRHCEQRHNSGHSGQTHAIIERILTICNGKGRQKYK
jgi:hypothetical protein